MTLEKFISYVMSIANVQNPDETVDNNFLSLTEEQIQTYLEIAMMRNFPELVYMLDEGEVPDEAVYPASLLTCKEMYYALAIRVAPKVDMGADNNNYLKNSQKFTHYMKLVEQVADEYDTWDASANGQGSVIKSYDVLLDSRYYTSRNYQLGKIPTVRVRQRGAGGDYVEVSWDTSVYRFAGAAVYVSPEPIVDPYASQKISKNAVAVTYIGDAHQTLARVEGLEPDSGYYVAVAVRERAGQVGYGQIAVNTTAPAENP